MTILMNGGNPQHVVGVTRSSGSHHVLVADPMTLSQSWWNDEVERVAKSLNGGESKGSFCAGVPESNCTGRVRDDDRILDGRDQLLEIAACLHGVVHR